MQLLPGEKKQSGATEGVWSSHSKIWVQFWIHHPAAQLTRLDKHFLSLCSTDAGYVTNIYSIRLLWRFEAYWEVGTNLLLSQMSQGKNIHTNDIWPTQFIFDFYLASLVRTIWILNWADCINNPSHRLWDSYYGWNGCTCTGFLRKSRHRKLTFYSDCHSKYPEEGFKDGSFARKIYALGW